MVRELEWDTNCFGYSVGELIIKSPLNFMPDELSNLSKDFRLIYIFSKNEIQLLSDNLVLADKKVVLSRQTESIPDNFNEIKSYHGRLTKKLLELSFQSGKYSRFRKDKFFINNEFKKLYTEWIENSLNRKIARDLFIHKSTNDINGFITLAIKGNLAEIGLIAVDPKYRGHGIGSGLIKYTVNSAFTLGYKAIQVVTQLDNKAALSLYHKNGFELTDLTYVYHYWNK